LNSSDTNSKREVGALFIYFVAHGLSIIVPITDNTKEMINKVILIADIY